MDRVSDARSSAVDVTLGRRIKALRLGRGLTLDGLAERSGVSRAMISRIERAESSATARLLGRLGDALDVTLSMLFAEDPGRSPLPLARRQDQPCWRDPGTGYLRRSVSPAVADGRVELVEVELPAGARVVFDRQALSGIDQLVWVLAGELDLAIGTECHRLNCGDCLHMSLLEPTTFHNPGPDAVRYAVVIAHAAPRGEWPG